FEACRGIETFCLQRLLARLEDPHRAPIDKARRGSLRELTSPDVERLVAEGMWHFGRGEDGAAEPLLRRALDECQTKLGSVHPITGAVLESLAVVYNRLTAPRGDDMPQELREFKEFLANRRLAEGEYPGFAAGLHLQAEKRGMFGPLDEAERIALGAATISRVVCGGTHPDYATSLRLLADVTRRRGQPEAAESLYRQALEIHSAVLGEAHPESLKSLHSLGQWRRERTG